MDQIEIWHHRFGLDMLFRPKKDDAGGFRQNQTNDFRFMHTNVCGLQMYVYSICMRQYDVNIEMCLNLLGPLSEPLSENQYFSEVLTQALMSD